MSKFKVVDGPYAGDYDIDPDDFSGLEANLFRKEVGCSMQAALAGDAVDVDTLAALVWIMHRRRSKGLPFAMVAENITRRSIQPLDDDADVAEDPLDPTSSGDG